MTDKPPKQRPPSQSAAGLASLKATYQQATAHTGLKKALAVLSKANQKQGFDCPGCAWPDPKERSWFEFCENGAKAILDEATDQRCTPEFMSQYALAELESWSDQQLGDAGRLIQPMLRPSGAQHYQAVSYEAAYELIASQLAQLDHPGQASFYTSGRTSNEAAYLYQLMVRCLGTNNLPDCSNLCHESSGVALKHTLGIGKGTVRLSDFEQADLILVIGQNPGTNHPRMLSTLRAAKLRGATIVSINPLVELGLKRFSHPQEPLDLASGGVEICDHFVRVQIAGDQALFRALNKRLLELEEYNPTAIDRAFIKEYTYGIEALEQVARLDQYADLERLSGVSFEQIDQLAQMVLSSRAVIACWAMGLTQHENAVDTICEVTNFLLLRGNMGKAGAGACPVRGHSNVQGDRSMGIVPKLPPAMFDKMQKRYQIELPKDRGLDSVASISAMLSGKIKMFMALGGNFLSASPDTELTKQALASCELTVHISTKLNRSHLAPSQASLILPCFTRSEKDVSALGEQMVSVENSMGVVHSSRGALTPAHPELRSETRIIGELAQVILKKLASNHQACAQASQFNWHDWTQNYSLIRDEIAAVIPGFDDFNAKLAEPGGFELDNGPRERRFTNAEGLALFTCATVRRIQAQDDELILMTIRSHDQFNTTIYSNNDRYRGISDNRRVLLMNSNDMKARNLKSGAKITIVSRYLDQSRSMTDFYALPYDLPAGNAAAYFPEANPLIFLDSFAAQSRTPTSKSIRIVVSAQSATSPSF